MSFLVSFKFRHFVRCYCRTIFLVSGAVCTASCSLSPFISSGTVDYNHTVEYATTSILVTNILRASDGAPLFFSDLSQIHGSFALNVSAQDTVPFGPLHGSTARGSAQGGPLAVNSTPSFDVAPLNTKQFYLGIMEPLNPNVLGYFLSRGVDANIVLNLLIGRVDVYQGVNGRYTQIDSFQEPERIGSEVSEWTYDRKHPPTLGTEHHSANFGPIVDANLANLITAAAAPGVEVSIEGMMGTHVRLKKASTDRVLCFNSKSGQRIAVGFMLNSVKNGPSEVKVPDNDSGCDKHANPDRAHTARTRYVVTLRSVESMFYYLGSIVSKPETSPIPFHLWDHPEGNVRQQIMYRGRAYYISNISQSDATTIILQILSDLLNINRDANEIPTTKSVTVQ
jgi:hypothetical protein